jgi:hypothetical protein
MRFGCGSMQWKYFWARRARTSRNCGVAVPWRINVSGANASAARERGKQTTEVSASRRRRRAAAWSGGGPTDPGSCPSSQAVRLMQVTRKKRNGRIYSLLHTCSRITSSGQSYRASSEGQPVMFRNADLTIRKPQRLPFGAQFV